jgi:Orsellinic acid/F9775 biosynthesis cluster protein D
VEGAEGKLVVCREQETGSNTGKGEASSEEQEAGRKHGVADEGKKLGIHRIEVKSENLHFRIDNARYRSKNQGVNMEPFVHVPECPFVICKRCKIGLVANEVINHVKRHADISCQRGSAIDQMAKDMPDIAKDQAGLQQWKLPAPDIDPIPYIEPPVQDGLGCNACPYVVRDVRQMQRHCRIEHGWVNDWKKGGNVAQRARRVRPPCPWRTGVRCQ